MSGQVVSLMLAKKALPDMGQIVMSWQRLTADAKIGALQVLPVMWGR